MAGLSALDMVNPYLSDRRQLICTELAILLPNTEAVIASNSKATSARFKEWTGHTQQSLEDAWKAEGFTKDAKTGSWTRPASGPVTTSCEGLIGQIFNKIESAGFGKRRGGGVTSFSLPGNDKYGKEPATPPPGWHWFRDKTSAVRPRAGDLFQIGRLVAPRQWYHHHVGVITGWVDGENPSWETVEAGQGGPGTGFDFIKRKGWRPLNPVDVRSPAKVLMGWLDIDEYFAK
ncbi:hypothetical protein [Plastoroseomonas hellenica]|uniref:Peptidase C51 domain-containing protein n=1 Tax=Plastoroseomonas hellenica TaxID=2687306 RepID=A0ABS5F856_9PROT|nr:hypothetical protein [Plastoroseomonas hellenica]MBR0646802.1 hypothetical protein [Plastoroseomonas hellenica]MBR0668750.1 hypothetical protein [Plastoroseomonas hellenica]